MSRFRLVKGLPSGSLSIVLVGLTLLLAGTAGCATQAGQAGGGAPPVAVTRQPGEGAPRSLTQLELQSELIAFTDRFSAILVSALLDFEERLPQGSGSRSARLISSRAKVYPLLAAMQVASGPNPAASLLDMVVLVTLYRMVWEEHWRANVFGEPADVLVQALQKLEADIWSVAGRVLRPDQQQQLRDLITRWRRDNPTVLGVTFIRFADFGESRGKSTLLEAARPGGLLAPVQEATRAAEEVRLLGERTTYLFTRLYALLPFHVELIYKEIATQPEVEQLLSGSARLMDTTERLGEVIGHLPTQVTEERSAAIRQLMESVAEERRAAIVQTLEAVTKERQLTLDQLFKNLTEMTRQLQAQISKERGAAIAEIGKTVEGERAALLLGMSQLIEKTERQGEHWINQVFIRGVLLIVVFFVAMFVYRVAAQRFDGLRRGSRGGQAA